jgi:hypothetical protein
VLAIAAANTTKLTGLVADLEFDPALCTRLSTPRLELAGRTTLGAEQVVVDAAEALGCPQAGRLALVLIDLAPRAETGEAVVPAGSGEIARWVVSLAAPVGAAAAVPIGVRVRAARNGPAEIALQTIPGFVTCAGNCNGDDEVAVNELIIGVNIAGGNTLPSACTPLDTNRNGEVVINELVAAVNNLLNGCRV